MIKGSRCPRVPYRGKLFYSNFLVSEVHAKYPPPPHVLHANIRRKGEGLILVILISSCNEHY